MKKIITAVAVASAMLLVSGCSTSTSPAPTVTVTEKEEVQVSPEQQYIDSLRSIDNVYIDNVPDESLIDLGYTLCSALDEGYSVEDIIWELVYGSFGEENGDDPDAMAFAGAVIGAGVKNLCPEYLSELSDLVYG